MKGLHNDIKQNERLRTQVRASGVLRPALRMLIHKRGPVLAAYLTKDVEGANRLWADICKFESEPAVAEALQMLKDVAGTLNFAEVELGEPACTPTDSTTSTQGDEQTLPGVPGA